MARKSLKDMSGIASSIARSGITTTDRATKSSAPALGALQGSLAAVREIEPSLIDDWGPVDRLDEFTAVNLDEDDDSFGALKNSIQDGGQQVPILVRRSKLEGRYEAIYGRRRLRACRELGIKVRANVQDVDDTTALLAKGLENAARRNLSFYEKARFAAAILADGHDGATAKQVLNLSASGLSHLTRVTQNVPKKVGDLVGPAPKSGRPKWTELAEFFVAKKLTERDALDILSKASPALNSDERLEALLKKASKRGARPRNGLLEDKPLAGVTVKSSSSSISVSVKKTGENAAFATWLDENISEIIKRSYIEFTSVNSKDET